MEPPTPHQSGPDASAAANSGHARKHDLLMIPESAMLLSRVLEREARKQNVLKRFRPSTVRRLSDDDSISIAPRRHAPIFGKGATLKRAISLRGPQMSATFRSMTSMRSIGRSSDQPSYNIVESHLPLRLRIYLLFHDPHSSPQARIVSVTLLMAVFVATIVYVMSTVPGFDDSDLAILSNIEATCIYLFTIDFLARFCCTPDRKAFLKDLFNWIDFASITPFYLELFLEVKGSSIGVIRVTRLFRVARILKLSRYTPSIQIFAKALTLSAKPMFMLLFLVLVAMIVFSSAMYFAELTDSPHFCRNPLFTKTCHPSVDPPDNCCELNPYYSIAATFWWCIVSMTTVGYGDDYPVTPQGKFIACLTMLSGLLILALPISVIGSNFQHILKRVAHNAKEKHLDSCVTAEIAQKKEMIKTLKGVNILGEGVDVDPDELVALYDIHKTGRLEEEALAQFRKDVEALQEHNMTIAPPTEDDEDRDRRLACAPSIADSRSRRSDDPMTSHVDAIEEILEIRLLESEVRFENKLNALMKIVSQMEKKVALLRD
ncbi:Aste57867_22653 [Aphanomyces stellatus]|uniref:Aste57867_22653 protein n=1 Tax=Aphanomyces stellatus TaxID=120398 RepID=A0A485LKI7_9STRA|nr:hypothetical protein As57867_022583 [Aphanomyces stellatus]VFT99307.1 Aste57867_22653 [Aphanomyces stellatus]